MAELNYQNIKTIYETTKTKKCNELLHNGWILLDVKVIQVVDIHISYSECAFILGNTKILSDNEINPEYAEYEMYNITV